MTMALRPEKRGMDFRLTSKWQEEIHAFIVYIQK